MLIWFEVLLMLLCGLLGICIICEVYVESCSYMYVMEFSSKDHKIACFIQMSF